MSGPIVFTSGDGVMRDIEGVPLPDHCQLPEKSAVDQAPKTMKKLLDLRASVEKAIEALKESELAKIKHSMAENGLSVADIEPAATPAFVRAQIIGNTLMIGDQPAPGQLGIAITDGINQTVQSKSEAKRLAAVKAPPKPGTKGSKLPIKYRNPANKAETWTGRGMKPKWLVAAMKKAKVKTPELFEV